MTIDDTMMKVLLSLELLEILVTPEFTQARLKDISEVTQRCITITAEELMQRQSGSSNFPDASGTLLSTTVKARNKKKRSSNEQFNDGKEQLPSGSGRRSSGGDAWDPIGSSIRAETRSRTTSIPMPEVHQGVTNPVQHIPLNTVMKTWENVPKLYQYRPAELQVIYHRRSGESEVAPLSPKHNHVSELNDVISPLHPVPLLHLHESSGIVEQENNGVSTGYDVAGVLANSIPSTSMKSNHVVLRSASTSPILGTKEQLFENENSPNEITHNHAEYYPRTPLAGTNSVECQTMTIAAEYFQLPQPEFKTNGQTPTTKTNENCSTQTDPYEPQPISAATVDAKRHFSAASQTDHLIIISSQTSIANQTDALVMIDQAIETEQCNNAALQRVIRDTTEASCQTDVDIETQNLCPSCECKDLQIEELEERLSELNVCLKSREGASMDEKKELFLGTEDASTNTECIPPELTEEVREKMVNAERENNELKLVIQGLNTRLHSYQRGLTRLRTAIEKPISDEGLSEDVIQEVLHKADDLIVSTSNSRDRALKINDHLTVLNACVNVANGILGEETEQSNGKN